MNMGWYALSLKNCVSNDFNPTINEADKNSSQLDLCFLILILNLDKV